MLPEHHNYTIIFLVCWISIIGTLGRVEYLPNFVMLSEHYNYTIIFLVLKNEHPTIFNKDYLEKKVDLGITIIQKSANSSYTILTGVHYCKLWNQYSKFMFEKYIRLLVHQLYTQLNINYILVHQL